MNVRTRSINAWLALWLAGAGAGALAQVAPAASAPAVAATTRAAMPFATVGDTVISGADFQRALAVAMRKKYYHAKPPEEEAARFQREVGEDVVNRVLLLAEAKRRGVQPDREKIKATVAGYDAQYGKSANWQANRDKMLAAVVPQLENESLMERFERIVKQVGEPTPAQARAYYDAHKELFVEPEQVKLSVIVLKVDPRSPQAAWNSAKDEAHRIHKKIAGGGDFAELAKLHSDDRTAAKGGAMEYTHRGMLPEPVQAAVDKLAPGTLAEPTQLLEGWAVLRLDARKAPVQRAYEQVTQRAAELWQREQAEQRWKQLIAELRRGTPVRIDESHYAPLRGPSEKPRAG
jgi:parvulin-like peptidyl-prolyl isomerase